MYVILVNDDNTLYASKKERIMQRSKLVDTLCFLVEQNYKEYDMTNSTVLLEYVLPISKKYCSEILVLSDDRYEEYLKYTLPFDTNITSEAGKVELQLTFICVDIDDDGNNIQRVRKTSSICINIIPISAWSDIIPDSALSAIDQRIIKTDAQIKAINDMNDILSATKADNIKYNSNSNELQLLSGSKEIGDKVVLKTYTGTSDDGVPIVDFENEKKDDDTETPSDDETDVIEF